jgi:hypothetical protein
MDYRRGCESEDRSGGLAIKELTLAFQLEKPENP